MYGERRSFAPIKVGEEMDVTIEAVGEKGDGIAKVKGFVIFVPNTKQGDKVKIKVTRVFRKVGFGEVMGEGTGSTEESSSGAEGSGDEEMSEESSEEETMEEDSDEEA